MGTNKAELGRGWRVWLAALVLLFYSPKAFAGDLPSAFTEALVALETSDCPTALTALRAIVDPPPEAIRQRVRFLTGYCLVKTERPAEALPLLEEAATEDALLADYAISYAARAALALEDQRGATQLLSRLLTRYPDSRLAEEAHFRLATTYLEMERHEAAEKALRDFLDRYPTSAMAPEASLLLAKLFLALKREPEAASLLKRLYVRFPTDPGADEAAQLIQEHTQFVTLTPDDHILRAKTLLREGRSTEAAAALSPLLHADPENEEIRLLLGRSLFATKEYPEAIATLLPLTDAPADSSLRVKALFLIGRASLRSGKYLQAIATLDRIPATFPRSDLADDALYLIGLNHEERGEADAALRAYARLLRRYPQAGLGDTARWRRAWVLYRRGDVRRADHELKHLLDEYPQSSQRAQALYWRGRLLEEMNRSPLAKQIYRRLVKQATLDPYYEWRARERLGLKPPRFSPGRPDPRKDALSPALTKARELFYLRMWADAAAEYWDLAMNHPTQIPLQWEACQALFRANEFDKVIQIARRTVTALISAGRKKQAFTLFWTFLYPRGFWPWIDQYVKETRLDPYLVTALIREESTFDPTALSRAGARGLMQLLPATAARVAAETDSPTPTDLDTPGVNIALGTRYLARMRGEFDGDLFLTIAAYNAGPRAVRRWLNDSHPIRDPETFVEEIPYPETRRYVKRVLGSYDRYRTLYARPR
ncbi:MAG: tetratricopeptide repeat protein [Candidatus Methylomirabilales bacterium]